MTKKPLSQCLPEWQAGIERMKELRPNIMQVSTNYPQAQQLNETGECDLFMSPDFPHDAVPKVAGAPVDQGMPKEGLFAMPAGVALVEGGPNQDAGITFLNEMLSPETQAYIAQDLLLAADQHQDRAAAGPELPRSRLARLGVFRRQPQRHDRALRAGGVGSMKSGPARAEAADRQARPRDTSRSRASRSDSGRPWCCRISASRSAAGEFVSLLGPSGCGKTTLLRLIAGLLAPELGTISIGGRDLTRVAAHRRNIGVVFQNYALFPHLTVAENVAFGLKAQGVAKAEIDTRVREALALVRMEGFADRSVLALSGGQQQRIAVARAIVVKPTLLLLDEPFSALDRKLRETMQIELRHLLRDLGITSIFVTHDQDEALVMSDRIAVMNEGRIEHLASPSRGLCAAEDALRHGVRRPIDPHRRPRRRRRARASSSVETPSGAISAAGSFAPGTPVVVGVRPEAILLGEGPEAEFNNIRAKVFDIVYFGPKTTLLFEAGGADRPAHGRARAPAAGARARGRRRDPLADRGHDGVSRAMTHSCDRERRRRSAEERRTVASIPRRLLPLPGLLFMTFAFALPLVLLVGESFTRRRRASTLEGYRKVLGDPYYVGIIWNSVQARADHDRSRR